MVGQYKKIHEILQLLSNHTKEGSSWPLLGAFLIPPVILGVADYFKRNSTKWGMSAAYRFHLEIEIFCRDFVARSVECDIDLLTNICNFEI
jgi:hypothetical protein